MANPPLVLVSNAAISDPGNILPVVSMDPIINSGTIGVFDHADPATWPGGNLPAAASLTNLVSGGAPAINGAIALVQSGGGFVFTDTDPAQNATPASEERITMPAAWKLPTTNKGFLYVNWLKYLANPAMDATALVGGWANNRDTDAQYAIWMQSSGIPALTINGTPGGFKASFGTAALVAGSIYQLAIAMQVNTAGTLATVKAFVNGVLVFTSAAVAFTTLYQTLAGNPTLGAATSGNFGSRLNMILYREWLEDLGASGADPAARVALDYAQNNGRPIYPFS